MDLNRLRTFRSVIATGSIRGAAQALRYSPASVSQQVAQLQRDTGLTLLSRVGRGVEPTPAGLALAARTDSLVAELADLDDFVAGLRAGRSGTYTLCYFSSLGAAWMPEIMARLTREFPDVRVELYVRDAYDPQSRPRPDLQLVAEAEPPPAPRGYQAIPLTSDPYVVAVPVTHPLAAHEGPLRLETLQHDTWIDTNAGQGSCRQITIDACVAAGFRPDLGVQAQDYATALAMVAAGVGISVLPRIGAKASPPGVVIRPVAPPTPRRVISALVATEALVSPVTERALALARRAAGSFDEPMGIG